MSSKRKISPPACCTHPVVPLVEITNAIVHSANGWLKVVFLAKEKKDLSWDFLRWVGGSLHIPGSHLHKHSKAALLGTVPGFKRITSATGQRVHWYMRPFCANRCSADTFWFPWRWRCCGGKLGALHCSKELTPSWNVYASGDKTVNFLNFFFFFLIFRLSHSQRSRSIHFPAHP